jgi:mRNA interferase RelE/StbE
LYKKIGNLRDSDPRKAGKPLTGPLEGLRSITHGRYRAIFSVDEEEIAGEEVRLHVRVVVEVVGIRKERDKRDVYKIATKLVELGLVPSQDEPEAHE